MTYSKWILPFIVISQFCCTSLWFAGNAVMTDLVKDFNLGSNALGSLTSAVQFGFIIGTLTFALFTISDQFSPSRVFFFCAVAAAICNLGTILDNSNLYSLFSYRLMTGFFLAGIYPVGMKIAADYYQEGLEKSLGYLVGALVLGTAFPHLLKGFSGNLPWRLVLISTSTIAIVGGVLMVFFVPDGPYRKAIKKPDFGAWISVFKKQEFRSAAFGYFGHMWELYAFWAFIPVMLSTYINLHSSAKFDVSIMSFLIIGLGSLACVLAGYLSGILGTKKIATSTLFLSCLCCIVSPLAFYTGSSFLFLFFLIFWGLVVIADSPLFSTLVAQNAPIEIKGTALTIVNCIGFSITIVSIQLLDILSKHLNPTIIFMILGIGPILGLIALKKRAISTRK